MFSSRPMQSAVFISFLSDYFICMLLYLFINFFLFLGDIELDTEDLCTLSNYESGLDPKVTYDLIEGHLPPPGLTVLTGGNSGYSNQTRYGEQR